ncbi:hypothetical protein HanRHA438_Chr05g0216691 [Helianthus annuus]|uniref:Uncharacterized protein n=1 Tax=Helianthus annuus TaxID=4232 RepID=A0A9K3IY00_HELAN|nr:hypothetical protein HanXRQr2_Chr05g0207071 [Helianthus annuus]KAJ0918334.1 hypothetical protein HanRHA438_Chr05g0216691 [Helianthus annuus]KAJ0922125.1 hypothetical protein HanPSC8_Chr05g0199961 [Helianthus annuus]
MMWHLGKICHNLDFSLHSSVLTCQISGRNFFQVGDDVTPDLHRVNTNPVNSVKVYIHLGVVFKFR